MERAKATFSGGSGALTYPERCDRQRDTMCHCERGDRLKQHPTVSNNEHEPEHE